MNNAPQTPIWWSGKGEPDLRSLYQWIDTESPHMGNQRDWGVWGGITGAAYGLAGGAIGILAGAMEIDPSRHPWVFFGPLGVATVVSLGAALVARARQLKIDQEARRTFAEARSFAWQLLGARWSGGVESLLGRDRALALNEGASHTLRCNHALRSVAWKAAGEGSEYGVLRERVGRAMDVAMARLISVIGRGVSGTDPEVQTLLSDMRIAADEAVKTASRLSGSTSEGTAGADLRQALSDMRMLNQAQDEYERLVNKRD